MVAQTHISYPEKELLQLIHSHLVAQGLFISFLCLFFADAVYDDKQDAL